MKSEDDNMKLEKEAPNLIAISKENAFEVPNGYFDQLAAQINSQLKMESLLGNQNDFSVPIDYFENLTSQIHAEVQLGTLKSSLENNGFTLPVNYFIDSQKRMEAKLLTTPKKSNVIKLHFLRYAAAACILLTTSLGVYINIKHSTSVSYQLSKIPATEIESYLNQHTDRSDLPMLIENIDDDIDLNAADLNLETK